MFKINLLNTLFVISTIFSSVFGQELCTSNINGDVADLTVNDPVENHFFNCFEYHTYKSSSTLDIPFWSKAVGSADLVMPQDESNNFIGFWNKEAAMYDYDFQAGQPFLFSIDLKLVCKPPNKGPGDYLNHLKFVFTDDNGTTGFPYDWALAYEYLNTHFTNYNHEFFEFDANDLTNVNFNNFTNFEFCFTPSSNWNHVVIYYDDLMPPLFDTRAATIILLDNLTIVDNINVEESYTMLCPENNLNLEICPNISNGNFTWVENENPNTILSTTKQLNINEGGTYTVSINDNNDNVCLTKQFDVIPELELDSQIEHILCNIPGTISLDVHGDRTQYLFYNWTPNIGNTNTVNPTQEGEYTVNITDAFGCIHNETFYVNYEDDADFDVIETINHKTCSQWGSIELDIPTEELADLTFNWSSDETTKDIYNLTPGFYTVEITKNNNCQVEYTYEVLDINDISFDFNYTYTELNCYQNGKLVVNLTNPGTSSYTYAWNNSTNTTNEFDVLTEGSYTAAVTNDYGCSRSRSFGVLFNYNLNPVVITGQSSHCNPFTGTDLTIGNVNGFIQWYRNNNSLLNSNVETYPITQTGTYTAKVTTLNCEEISEPFVVESTDCCSNTNGQATGQNVPVNGYVHTTGGTLPLVAAAPYNIEGQLIIRSNTILSGTDIVFGEFGEIIIEDGYELTIKPYITEAGPLGVGGELNITHLYACLNMWRGIKLNGPNAKLTIEEFVVIEDALTAIHAQNNAQLDVNEVVFNKNYKSIVVENYNLDNFNPDNFSVKNSYFLCAEIIKEQFSLIINDPNNPLNIDLSFYNEQAPAELKPPHAGEISNTAIEVNNVKSTSIIESHQGFNMFTDELPYFIRIGLRNKISKHITGIKLTHSSVELINNDFNQLNIGVDIINTSNSFRLINNRFERMIDYGVNMQETIPASWYLQDEIITRQFNGNSFIHTPLQNSQAELILSTLGYNDNWIGLNYNSDMVYSDGIYWGATSPIGGTFDNINELTSYFMLNANVFSDIKSGVMFNDSYSYTFASDNLFSNLEYGIYMYNSNQLYCGNNDFKDNDFAFSSNSNSWGWINDCNLFENNNIAIKLWGGVFDPYHISYNNTQFINNYWDIHSYDDVRIGLSPGASQPNLRIAAPNTTFVEQYGGCFSFAMYSSAAPATLIQSKHELEESYHLSPNPSNGIFTVNINNDSPNVELIVFNSQGQEVYKQSIQLTQTYIELDLKPGIYPIQIKDLDSRSIKIDKLVIY
jgi:hypothetical protein